jgi:hypothetical protein
MKWEKYVLRLLAFAVLLAASISFAQEDEFAFRGGLARTGSNGELEIYKETTDIPLIKKATDPDYYFGVIVSSRNGKSSKCRVVIRAPKPNSIQINPDKEKHDYIDHTSARVDSQGADYVTISSDENICSNTYYALMQFNEGDRPGPYSINIFIDNTLRKQFNFTVQPIQK